MFRPNWIRNRDTSERIQNYPTDETDDSINEKNEREGHDNISTLHVSIRLPISYVNCADELTESITSPSPPRCAGLSKSALYLNTATRVDAMENEEKRIATNPAIRAILSRPGKERKVTDALKRTAAFRMESN
jgi:hypothetical protein